MQIQCPECSKSFSLPSDRTPKAATVFKCPSCGGRIPVDPATSPAAPAPVSQPEEPSAPTAVEGALPKEAMDKLERQVVQEILHSLGLKSRGGSEEGEEGNDDAELALVCEDEELFQSAIRDTLRKQGYRVEIVPTAKQAMERVSQGQYAIVTVDNHFPDDPDGGYKILQAINSHTPERRRKMFVAFISADLATMDLNSAFILGANLTVGKKDVSRLDKILSEGVRENSRRYRVFLQVEEEVHAEKL